MDKNFCNTTSYDCDVNILEKKRENTEIGCFTRYDTELKLYLYDIYVKLCL